MELLITDSYRREWPADDWTRMVKTFLQRGDDIVLVPAEARQGMPLVPWCRL